MRKIFTIKIIIGTLIIAVPTVIMAAQVTRDDLIMVHNQFKQRKSTFEDLKASDASDQQKIIQAKEVLGSGCEVFSYSLTYYKQNLAKLTGAELSLVEQHQADITSAEDWVLQKQLAVDSAQEKDQLQAISQEMAVKWQDLKNQTAASRAELLVSKIKMVLVDIEDASRLVNDTHTILVNKKKSSDQADQAINELNQELKLAQDKYDLAKTASDELADSNQAYQDFSLKIVIIRDARTQTETAKNKIKPAVKALEELVLISE